MTLLHTAGAISAEIKRRLELCTVAQGAETDLGRKVHQGKRTLDESHVPCSTLIEGDDTPERQNVMSTTYLVEQRFAVLAYVPCSPDDPNLAAHAAIRDVKRALFARPDGKADPDLGGTAKSIEYLGKQIGPRAEGARFVLAIVEVSVDYVENVATP